MISFDLSSPSAIRLLSKHWMEREKDCHPLQDFKEDVCTGNIMEVVERELQKYLKERYNYTNNVQLQPTVPITLMLHCCENIIFLDLLIVNRDLQDITSIGQTLMNYLRHTNNLIASH